MTTLSDVNLSETSSPSTTAVADAGAVCHTKSVVSELGPAVKADVQEMRFIAEDYVIEHPLKTVALAAGVGFLLGVLWSR